MSNDTAPEEKEQENEKPKVAPRPVLRGLPQWFQDEYGQKRPLPPLENDPRRIGPAAQQEKKPL